MRLICAKNGASVRATRRKIVFRDCRHLRSFQHFTAEVSALAIRFLRCSIGLFFRTLSLYHLLSPIEAQKFSSENSLMLRNAPEPRRTWVAVLLTSGMAGLNCDLMMLSSHCRAVVQLLAITLHSLLLGIVVLASVPQASDRAGEYRPARESRLVALHDQIDGTALNRGVKRYDNQSPAGFWALACFRQAQVQQASRVHDHPREFSYRPPTLGFLPIRSPPSHLPL